MLGGSPIWVEEPTLWILGPPPGAILPAYHTSLRFQDIPSRSIFSACVYSSCAATVCCASTSPNHRPHVPSCNQKKRNFFSVFGCLLAFEGIGPSRAQRARASRKQICTRLCRQKQGRALPSHACVIPAYYHGRIAPISPARPLADRHESHPFRGGLHVIVPCYRACCCCSDYHGIYPILGILAINYTQYAHYCGRSSPNPNPYTLTPAPSTTRWIFSVQVKRDR